MSERWCKMTPSTCGHSPFQGGELAGTSESYEELELPSWKGGAGGGLFQVKPYCYE